MSRDVAGTENYTNGPIEIPTQGNVGQEVFDILEEFMDRLAIHQHTGADSKPITVNIDKDTTDYTSGVDFNWEDLGFGNYRARLDTDPTGGTGATFSANVRKYFYEDGGEYFEFYPTVIRDVADFTNQFYHLHMNDNAITTLRVVAV